MRIQKVQILKSTDPQLTSGAQMGSPTTLISGTAVPALAPDVNTAVMFGGINIILTPILTSERAPRQEQGRVIVARRRRSSRAKRISESRQKFDMMPAYSKRLPGPEELPQTVRSALAIKAQEEMSDFDREYPW